MLVLSRQIDESVMIGRKLMVTLTDVDARSVQIRVRGELIGGADDGLSIDRVFELAVGSNQMLGPLVNVILVELIGAKARFGFIYPRHISVHRKEIFDVTERDES